jgi:hypothetical protein
MAPLEKVYETVMGWMCSATALRFWSTRTGRPPERDVSRYVSRDVRRCLCLFLFVFLWGLVVVRCQEKSQNRQSLAGHYYDRIHTPLIPFLPFSALSIKSQPQSTPLPRAQESMQAPHYQTKPNQTKAQEGRKEGSNAPPGPQRARPPAHRGPTRGAPP